MRMVSVVALFLLAPTVLADEALWTLLRGGGHIVLMRHATTTPGVGDPPGFSLGELSDPAQPDRRRPGRGAAGGRGIPVPRRPGRARAVEPLVPVSRDGAPGVRPRRSPGSRSTRSSRTGPASPSGRARYGGWSASGPPTGNLVLVTHGANIQALTGINPAPGEFLVLTPEPGGRFRVAGRLAPAGVP